ncbi:hypothetical protein BON22_5432 [Cyberlindnera fabianii]|uniref:Uncharacterized protein n=1 Tax=Cyberlindnera fabianii TaxID=36022 RepID=A0A1V2L110_CYBFA|nr:hypothetical protein BON22_5432 [Cyberlindnera fabianii]
MSTFNAIRSQAVSRHREVLGENWNLVRLRVVSYKNNLLLNVKTDIEDHQRRFKQDEMDYAHEEQQRANALKWYCR